MEATPPPEPPEPPEPNPYTPPRAATPAPARRAMGPLAAAGGVVLVILAGAVAFLATCFPVGVVTLGGNAEGAPGTPFQNNFPWFVGLVAGLVAGGVTARLVFRKRRRIDPPAPTDEAKPR